MLAIKRLKRSDMASDDLIVFGYGSKLFQDDIAADYCEKEKQLRSHELDSSVTIDRYEHT